jgi:hypothetical protein
MYCKNHPDPLRHGWSIAFGVMSVVALTGAIDLPQSVHSRRIGHSLSRLPQSIPVSNVGLAMQIDARHADRCTMLARTCVHGGLHVAHGAAWHACMAEPRVNAWQLV